MPFKIVRNDITKMQVDAIVNTANEAPIYSDGVDTAVYEAAGAEQLLAERKKIGFLNEGDVAITHGFKLPCKYIIHAVSPFYEDGESGEEELLRSCYQKSLQLAKDNNCESIAFPLISTGSFGYPKEEGMRIAVDEISAFLLKNNMQVFLVVFDAESTRLGMNLYPDLEEYIDQNYVCDKSEEEYGDSSFDFCSDELIEYNVRAEAPTMDSTSRKLCVPIQANMRTVSFFDEELWEKNHSALNERMKHLSDTFQEYLLYLIESKGLTNAEVYKRAIITKQLFSKIKVNPEYHPDKATAMRLCVGAKLNLDETKDLLARAGYALSPCDKRDIIFSFFIEREVYDMIEIDIVLEEQGLPCFIE
jgi:O-acetyl-ADP-ribose deacetylase (regulator of RNase III)